MNREVNTPNIVVDDNYRMLVNRLTRRYAERGASVYTDAEAIKQERSDARARAIAPDAYRISKTLGDNPDMYKSGMSKGVKYMTTDDYLVYFSKCHDTFNAVNYYNLHKEAPETEKSEARPRVLVNRKRMEIARRSVAMRGAEPRAKRDVADETAMKAERGGASAIGSEETARKGRNKRKAVSVFAAAAASLALIVGSVFAILPTNDADYHENLSRDEIVNLAENEGQEVLQNRE